MFTPCTTHVYYTIATGSNPYSHICASVLRGAVDGVRVRRDNPASADATRDRFIKEELS